MLDQAQSGFFAWKLGLEPGHQGDALEYEWLAQYVAQTPHVPVRF
jgi:hypothetical protein